MDGDAKALIQNTGKRPITIGRWFVRFQGDPTTWLALFGESSIVETLPGTRRKARGCNFR